MRIDASGATDALSARGGIFTSTYPPGTSIGSVVVADAAGHVATQSFTVAATSAVGLPG